MQKQDIIAIIDPAIYAIECEDARKAAPRYLTDDLAIYHYYVSDLPDEITTLIWDDPTSHLTAAEQIRLTVAIYRDLPCYDLLQPVAWHYTMLSEELVQLYGTKCAQF